MMNNSLFDTTTDFHDDVYRNIVSLRESVDLFADLTVGDPELSKIATQAEINVKKDTPSGMINRGYFYNTAVLYPFDPDNFISTRFSDGSFGVWYGSLSLLTSVYETAYHMFRELNAIEGIDEVIIRERAVYLINCSAILLDLTEKAENFPKLVSDDYAYTQGIGKRLNEQGHPGLLVPSARHRQGINLAAFNPNILRDPRQHCYLSYSFDPKSNTLQAEREPGNFFFNQTF